MTTVSMSSTTICDQNCIMIQTTTCKVRVNLCKIRANNQQVALPQYGRTGHVFVITYLRLSHTLLLIGYELRKRGVVRVSVSNEIKILDSTDPHQRSSMSTTIVW